MLLQQTSSAFSCLLHSTGHTSTAAAHCCGDLLHLVRLVGFAQRLHLGFELGMVKSVAGQEDASGTGCGGRAGHTGAHCVTCRAARIPPSTQLLELC